MKYLYVLYLLLFWDISCFCQVNYKLDIENNISPKNLERPLRTRTLFLVLHTTESGNKSAINSLKRRGEANYLVLSNGKVQRIISKERVAYHAGRSMWNGIHDISTASIGIEVVGYHNKKPTRRQLRAIKQLIKELKRIYNIPDENVLTHSMVAYGSPNRWHKYKHRGRKRCGMYFAKKEIRKQIGLNNIFYKDPDVLANRLKSADTELHNFLYAQKRVIQNHDNVITKRYSAWYIARERFNDPGTFYTFPNGETYSGDQIKDWSSIPSQTRVTFGKRDESLARKKVLIAEISDDTPSAWSIAGADYRLNTTIYFLRNGQVKCGNEMSKKEINNLDVGTKILVGYIYGGHISKERSAYDIAKRKWNDRHTIYRFPDGSIHEGDSVKDSTFVEKTLVLFRR